MGHVRTENGSLRSTVLAGAAVVVALLGAPSGAQAVIAKKLKGGVSSENEVPIHGWMEPPEARNFRSRITGGGFLSPSPAGCERLHHREAN